MNCWPFCSLTRKAIQFSNQMCQIWSLKYVAIELSSPLWERITIFFGFHATFYFYFSLAMKREAWLTWMVMGVMASFGSPSQTVYSSAFPHAWPVSLAGTTTTGPQPCSCGDSHQWETDTMWAPELKQSLGHIVKFEPSLN